MLKTKSVINIGMRGATLVSKFLLLFFLAIYFQAGDLGLYGLITASIGYALYVFGFDFYLYSGREFVGSSKSEIGKMIKDQFILFALSYLVLSPIFLIVFARGYIPWSLAPLFYGILILEHIGQELNRVLVTLSSQLWASLLLFIRSGVWCLIVILLMWKMPIFRNIDTILIFWLVGSAISSILGIRFLLINGYSGWRNPIDWNWIRRGIKISLPFFVTTLAMQALFTVDRYIMKINFGDEVLGAYVLFVSFAFAISTFVDAGAFVFYYPMLIEANKNSNSIEFNKTFKDMTKNVILLVSILSVLALVLIEPILLVTKKIIYIKNKEIFYIILVAIWFQVLGWIPQYGLYAKRNDRQIIYSNLIPAIAFFPIVLIFLDRYQKYGVAFALVFVFLLSFIMKTLFFLRANRGINE